MARSEDVVNATSGGGTAMDVSVKDPLTRRQARSALTAHTWTVLRLRLWTLRWVMHTLGIVESHGSCHQSPY